jgi:peptide/nickel transport system permease protein
VVVLCAVTSPLWLPHDPVHQYRDHAWAAPSWQVPAPSADAVRGELSPSRPFLLGTDQFGRDLFSRFVAGGRTSLVAAAAATALTMVIALAMGLAGAAMGGTIDAVLAALGDGVASAPWLVLAVAVRAALPLDATPVATLTVFAAVVAAASWPRQARHVRVSARAVLRSDFVRASLAAGASPMHVAWWHLVPQAATLATARAAGLLPRVLMAEVTLSALGLGIAEPTPTWGTLVGGLQRAALVGTYWWTLLPMAGMIVLLWWASLLVDERRDRGWP